MPEGHFLRKARRYRSGEGSGPAKPPMSNPQKGMPVMAAESPAVRALRSSLLTDC